MLEALTELTKIGMEKGYIEIIQKNGSTIVRYLPSKKECDFANTEERVRTEVYVELIERYGYFPENILIDECHPSAQKASPSDIVVYTKDNSPFIVVEVEKPEISESDIETGIKKLFANANLFGVRWALFTNRKEKRCYFSLDGFSYSEETRLRKDDIPIRYGQPTKFLYGNEVGFGLCPITEISKFQRLMESCHDIIRDNENLSPASAFPIISRIIYSKKFDELHTPKDAFYRFQVSPQDTSLSLAERIAGLYTLAASVEPDIFPPFLGIKKPETLVEIVEKLQSYDFTQTPYDTKGEAYQSFLGRIMRGPHGQYFTPREVIKPTVEMISPDENEKIIDPCCGTGGFLIYALDHLRKLLSRRYPLDEKTKIRKEYDIAHYNLFGIEVDPNVGEACITGMLLEEDAHGHIAIADALSDWANPTFLRKGIVKGKFKVLMTNPPFGKKTRIQDLSNKFTLARQFKRPPFEVLILERAIEFLEPGGRCAFVIPDINLTNRRVLNFLFNKVVITGIISLPPETFRPYGSNAKTSVLFFIKKKSEQDVTNSIFMANVTNIGYDATGRKKADNQYEKVVPYFHKFLRGEKIEREEHDGFVVFELDVKEGFDNNLRVDSHLNKIPLDQNYVPLEHVAHVWRGWTPAWNDYSPTGIPILKVRNLRNQFIDFTFERRGHVPERIFLAHPENHVRLYDILLTASAHSPEYIAKKIDIVDTLPTEKIMAVGELMIIRPRLDKVNPFYLVSVLRKSELNDQFRACIKGTTAHIYPKDVAKKVRIPLIPMEKQNELGEALRKALLDFRQFESKYREHLKIRDKVLA